MPESNEPSWVAPPLSVVNPWLLESTEPVFAMDADRLLETYQLRVGDRPFARSLRTLYVHRGQPYPAELAALPGEVYAVMHAVAVYLAEGRPNHVQSVGYDASFTGAGSTCELLPTTRFRQYAALGVDAHLNVGLTADGFARAPAVLDGALPTIPLGASADITIGGGVSMLGNLRLSLSLKTLEIQAVGTAASRVTWQFDKGDVPLVGDQVLVQTILVPRGRRTVDYRIRGCATIDPGWRHRPVRIETAELAVDVRLPVPEAGAV